MSELRLLAKGEAEAKIGVSSYKEFLTNPDFSWRTSLEQWKSFCFASRIPLQWYQQAIVDLTQHRRDYPLGIGNDHRFYGLRDAVDQHLVESGQERLIQEFGKDTFLILDDTLRGFPEESTAYHATSLWRLYYLLFNVSIQMSCLPVLYIRRKC